MIDEKIIILINCAEPFEKIGEIDARAVDSCVIKVRCLNGDAHEKNIRKITSPLYQPHKMRGKNMALRLFPFVRSHQFRNGDDMSPHRPLHVRFCTLLGKIQKRVQREEFEKIAMTAIRRTRTVIVHIT